MNTHSNTEDFRRIEKLEQENEFLRCRLEKLPEENERQRKELEEALRSLKRQASPFSKGKPKSNPHRSGRKPGVISGQRDSRPIPRRIEELIPVPLPQHSGCRV
jgi:hypothetical protein